MRTTWDAGLAGVPVLQADAEAQLAEGWVLHVALEQYQLPVCMQNGDVQPAEGDLVLCLDGPSKGADRHKVNCPVCLEWMHA